MKSGNNDAFLNKNSPGSWLPILSDETGDRSVECPFHFRGKQAPGKLTEPLVVNYTLTTFALFIAGFVGADTISLIEFEITFHH